MESAEKILSAELQKIGFAKQKNKFFIKTDDMIFLIAFEKPSELLYLQFALIPLFVPCPGHIYYTYGNRLNNIFSDFPVFHVMSTESQLKAECDVAIQRIRENILPFTERISSAEKLCDVLFDRLKRKDKIFSKYIFCDPVNLLRLQLYVCLYTENYGKCRLFASQYVEAIKGNQTYSRQLTEKKIAEIEQVTTDINEKKYDEINSMLRNNIRENLELFS
ncbi:MAG: hypothetical protein IJ766_09015 [Clostridia bacterium]|nr:hypothetical protein [Clostridia bacterium]